MVVFLLSVAGLRNIQINSLSKLNGKDCSPSLSCSKPQSNHGPMMMAFGSYSSFFEVTSSWITSDDFQLQVIINTNSTCSIDDNPFDQVLVSETVQGSGTFGPFSYSSGHYSACIKVIYFISLSI